jgi:dihydrofolate synthase/folylpolyglutamate synthase
VGTRACPAGDGVINDYSDAVAYLNAHIGRGMRPGLARIEGLLELMGDPQQAYPVIHVAGTNGKTSVSRMSSMVLVAHGLTAGTFTSPHLERVEERIALNGVHADRDEFTRAVADVAAFADIYEERSGLKLSYFEITAAMALAWFADQAADAAVVEVGLGGRLDATNVVQGAVAVLTSIGLDHRTELGDTIERIAAEKLAIAKPGSVLVAGPLQPELGRLVAATMSERDLTVHRYGVDFHVEGSAPAAEGWNLDIEGIHGLYEDIHLPVHGRHQTINLAVAIAAAEALVGRALDPAAVVEAAAVMTAPGRLESVAAGPLVMLDGAHNGHGFRALAAALREEFPNRRWVLLTGAVEGKDLDAMYPALAGVVDRVITTSFTSPAAIDAHRLRRIVSDLVDLPVEAVAEPTDALERARDAAGVAGSVLVAGSLYLVGAVRAYVLGNGGAQPNER